MDTLSSRMICTSKRLLQKYGIPITAVYDTVSDSDPTTGAVSDSGADIDYSGVGYPSSYKENQINNTTILRSDIRLIFYSTTKPQVNDILAISGVAHTALSVQNITVSGVSVLYIVQCRVL